MKLRSKRQIVLNKRQAEETAKMLLNLCQAVIIATAASVFATGFTLDTRSILTVVIGTGIALFLYLVAMSLLRKRKRT